MMDMMDMMNMMDCGPECWSRSQSVRDGRAMTRAILPGERCIPPPTLCLLACLTNSKKHARHECPVCAQSWRKSTGTASRGKTKDCRVGVRSETRTYRSSSPCRSRLRLTALRSFFDASRCSRAPARGLVGRRFFGRLAAC